MEQIRGEAKKTNILEMAIHFITITGVPHLSLQVYHKVRQTITIESSPT